MRGVVGAEQRDLGAGDARGAFTRLLVFRPELHSLSVSDMSQCAHMALALSAQCSALDVRLRPAQTLSLTPPDLGEDPGFIQTQGQRQENGFAFCTEFLHT
ncbi:hypothetical protein UY3_06772 [Chelonia mydas]|uniref:Uncharacterized protein n=1 Tax=Chelonia mydas TaxID=8469 RepID=M7BVD1_CHEMY|nr:hypothetical protein UY3_06772 [Chelonia mydas]